jgi:hypothetical protein
VKLTGYLEVGARAGRNHGGGATLTRRGAQIQGYPTREGGSDKSIGDNRMTRAEYDGDNPLRLADECSGKKFGDVGGDAPRFIAREELRRQAPAGSSSK